MIPFYIVSTYTQDTDRTLNNRGHRDARKRLDCNDVPFREVYGRFDGDEERGFQIPAKYSGWAMHIAQLYGQKLVLRVSEKSEAHLIDVDSQEIVKRGTWFVAFPEDLGPNADYTLIPGDWAYYQARWD